MSLPFHPADSYHTPADTKRLWLDRVLPHFQVAFKWKFLGVVMRSRTKALQGVYDDQEWISSSIEILRILESCGGRFNIEGMDNLRKIRKPAVLISNHMSILETMVFPGLIAPNMKVTFVVKDSLVSHKIFGPVMRSRDPIVVSRENSREDLVEVMTKGTRLLSGGCSIVIFPQSTRRLDFLPEEFNSLGVKLAAKAGVPVIPIAIKTDFWLNGKILKDLGPIDRSKPIFIRFGEPMEIKGNGKEENQAIIRFIQSNLDEWNSIIQD